MILNNKSIIILAFFLTFLISCNGGEMSKEKIKFPSIKDFSATSWEKLSQKKIYFGHQSVGNKIIAGMRDVLKDHPQIKLNIVEITDPGDLKGSGFAHSPVGRNQDPISKIRAFSEYIHKGLGNKADIAFFKFCYIDITPETDVEEIFNEYKKTMLELKENYPDTKFMHVTVPLKVVQTGPRVWIKNLIGRPIGGYAGNIKRNQFNELLKKEYKGNEPIFDLGMVESVFPDGTRNVFTKNGKNYFALVPEYSHDGRHLNEKGRRIVAEQLLIYLANL